MVFMVYVNPTKFPFRLIAVKEDFQNSAIFYLTSATYLFMVPRLGPRGFNAKYGHFWTARIYG